MDMRKSQSSSVMGAKKIRTLEWIGGIKQEFNKITWTKKEELKAYTKVVVGSIFVVGIGIYFVDLVVQGALSGVGSLVKAVVG